MRPYYSHNLDKSKRLPAPFPQKPPGYLRSPPPISTPPLPRGCRHIGERLSRRGPHGLSTGASRSRRRGGAPLELSYIARPKKGRGHRSALKQWCFGGRGSEFSELEPPNSSGCGSKPMGSQFEVGAPPILEPILVRIRMFTGGTGF